MAIEMLDDSKHAQVRAQKRAIPPFVRDLLVDYGRVVRRHGADVYFLDRKARKALQRDMGCLVYKRLCDLLDSYVVVGEGGTVITAAHRFKRAKL